MKSLRAVKVRWHLQEWAWHYVCAASILFVMLAVYTVAVVSGFSASPLTALLVSFWSMKLLFLLPPLLLIPFMQRWWSASLILLPIAICFIWQLASLELYAVQCRFLSFEELSNLWSTAETRPLIYEQVFAWKLLFFLIAFYATFFLCAYALKRMVAQRFTLLHVPLVVFVLIAGHYCVDQRSTRKQEFKPASLSCMPWSCLSSTNSGYPVAQLAEARKQWKDANPLFWAPGAASFAKFSSPQYKDRSVVVILMESHGTHYLDDFGSGSVNHKASSPFLSQLAQENIYFKNYYQSGYVTHAAAWSLLGGFPYFNESAYTPQLVGLGVVPAFQDSGYTCEWLQSTTPLFANFNELTHNLSMATGLSKAEEERMRNRDDSLWSAWGMPDEQLFEVAFDRIEQRLVDDAGPYLQIVLTVSNHNPFHLPEHVDGVRLLRDASGGMRYADACLKVFMDKISEIEEDKRPLVFITADTGFRSVESIIFDQDELGAEPLESLRIPGVLVLPDAQQRHIVRDVFCHEDALPMLAALTGVDNYQSQRLQNFHRRAAVINDYDGHTIVGQDFYFYAGVTLMAIKDYWQLEWVSPDGLAQNDQLQDVYTLMRKRYDYLREQRDAIWLHAGEGVFLRDQKWDLIGPYEQPSSHQDRVVDPKDD